MMMNTIKLIGAAVLMIVSLMALTPLAPGKGGTGCSGNKEYRFTTGIDITDLIIERSWTYRSFREILINEGDWSMGIIVLYENINETGCWGVCPMHIRMREHSDMILWTFYEYPTMGWRRQ